MSRSEHATFMLGYHYKAYNRGIKKDIVKMAYVGNKANQRWLWLAIDHATGTAPAYVCGKRKDELFRQLQVLLEPFGISRFYSNDRGEYERIIDPEKHEVGKRNTRKIER